MQRDSTGQVSWGVFDLDEFFSKGDLFDLTGILKHLEQTTSCEVVVRITSDRMMMEETARAEYTQLGLHRSDEKTGLEPAG